MEKELTPFAVDEKKYSSLLRLLRIIEWVLRFITKVRKEKTQTGELKASEIKQVKILWIKSIQRTNFPDAFKGKNDYKNQLEIHLHEDGRLRCHGRMVNAQLPLDAMYPILLPKRSHFTTLLIKEYHQKLFHSVVFHTLSQLRNEYWIPQGRAKVKKQFMAVEPAEDFKVDPSNYHQCLLGLERKWQSLPHLRTLD